MRYIRPIIFLLIAALCVVTVDEAFAKKKNAKAGNKKKSKKEEPAKKGNDKWPADDKNATANFHGILYKVAGSDAYYIKPKDGTIIYGRVPWALDISSKLLKNGGFNPAENLKKPVTVKGVFTIQKRTGEEQFKFSSIKSVTVLAGEQELPAGLGSPVKGNTALTEKYKAGDAKPTTTLKFKTSGSAFDKYRKK